MEGISLYIHLPFCESMCTFCNCHKSITKSYSVENPYITAVLKEWVLYCRILGAKPQIKEIHLGPRRLFKIVISRQVIQTENFINDFTSVTIKTLLVKNNPPYLKYI
jgi:hypothetical protein